MTKNIVRIWKIFSFENIEYINAEFYLLSAFARYVLQTQKRL